MAGPAPARRKGRPVGFKPLLMRSIEMLDEPQPYSRALFERLGVRGLNVGSGKSMHAGCVNVDNRPIEDGSGNATEPDRLALIDGEVYYLDQDARDPYPLEDGCLEWAYSGHLIEHMSFADAVRLLGELRRLVKPGGLIRISTPSLRRYVEGYLDPDKEFYEEHRRRLSELPMFRERGVPERPGWMLNQVFRLWGHKFIFDFEELREAAELAGFDPQGVAEASFRQGRVPELAALDTEGRDDVSLYVEITR